MQQLRGADPETGALIQLLLEEHRDLADAQFLEGVVEHPGHESSLAGQTMGAYTLIRPVGHGGMGTVWLAQRSDGRFDRQAAIKFLNFALASQGGGERFKREGSILGRLTHPNVAELIDAGVTPTGAPYLVLEYVDGKHIDQYCDDQRLGIEQRIGLFLDILGAVAQAHANLIVHRDIKPSNVLVRNDGHVKLLDFGIAKLLAEQEGRAEATALSLEQGGAAMTPRFAAPEQVTGGTITTATDVYALGVLLYVLLTGQHPAGPETSSPAELVKAIVETEPMRPSNVFATSASKAAAESRGTTREKLHRQLRGDLDTIVSKAIKKNSKERYSSVSTFADDLWRYLKHEPIGARPDKLTYRVAKFVRRNRTAVALSTLALLAVIAGITGTLMQARTAREQRDFARLQLARAERFNELNQFLLSDASASDKPFTVAELLDRARQIVERENYSSDPVNHVEMLISIGKQYADPRKASPLLEKAYQLSRSLHDPTIRSRAACALAAAIIDPKEHARAESLFQEGIRDLPNRPEFALDRVLCLLQGSEVANGASGSLEESVARSQAAQKTLEGSDFSSGYLRLKVLRDLGRYNVESHLPQAITADQQAVALQKDLGYDQTATAADTFQAMGIALMRAGRPAEAEQSFRRALDILGDTVPFNLQAYAEALRQLGRLDEAEDYAKRAYSAVLRRKDDTSGTMICLLELARVYTDQGNIAGAEKTFSRAEEIARKIFPPGYYYFWIIASDRSHLSEAEGKLPAALVAADQAVTLVEASIRSGKGGGPWLPWFLYRRAAIEVTAAQPEKAVADARRALSLLQSALGTEALSRHIGLAYLQMGRALQAEGKLDEARAASRSAAEHLAKTVGPEHSETRVARQLAGITTP
jgi:serine/threonine-protein kinase